MRFVTVLFLFCWAVFVPVFAQQPDNKGIEEVAIDLPALPPLSVLIDSALARSPQMSILEKQKQESEINLKLTKRDLLQRLRINSGYNYGKGGTVGVSESSTTTIPTAIYSNRTMSQYSLGFSFGVSIGDILDRGSKIKLAKIQIDKSEDQLRGLKDEIALKVYEEYSKLQSGIESLKGMMLLFDSYRAQLILTEKDYLNNRVQLSQLTSAKEAYTKTLLSVENQKRECRLSVFTLERMTGVSFSKQF